MKQTNHKKKCKKCESPYVANKHFCLCHRCNELRLRDKGHRKPPKPIKKKKDTLPALKKKLTTEAIMERNYQCAGCGAKKAKLDASHIIPISIDRKLREEPKNIQFLCRSCHLKWEHGPNEKRKQLYCYNGNIDYIKSVNIEYFHRKFEE